MNQHSGAIPHALAKAYGDLVSALDAGIERYEQNQQYSNSRTVRRCIERFVDAFHVIPDGQEELRRRATLVESLSGPGSDYERARKRALASYRGRPKKITRSKLAISKLRKSIGGPTFLDVVTSERDEIEILVSDRKLNLSTIAREAYELWRNACREVEREAAQLEVDGCWHVYHIHEAGEASPSDLAGIAKTFNQSSMGGANLTSIKAAAESLMAWASERASINHGSGTISSTRRKPKRRGRKRADDVTVQRESQLATEWNRAREAGVYKADFANENGFDLKSFDQLLDRVATRKRRSDNRP